ncbi:MAG: hypothetical protein II845_03415 [Oscillospiraceae bacterium]|nr:hypothetical protein [Oscillospiraceae bacterium]
MNNLTIFLCATTVVLIIIVVILASASIRNSNESKKAKEAAQEEIKAARESYESKRRELIEQHIAELSSLRDETARQIQITREHIEARKDVLAQMDEKKLLASIIIALEGYGKRLDRIEQQVSEDQFSAKMTALLQDLTTKINSIADSFTSQIDATASSIEEHLSENDLSEAIDRLRSTVRSISDTLDQVQEDTNSIRYSVSENMYYSIPSELKSIRWAVDEAKDAAESAKSAIEMQN